MSVTSIIGPQCLERFLPTRLPEAQELRNRGVAMGGISSLKPPYQMIRRPATHHAVLCTTAGGGVWTSRSKRGEIRQDSSWLFPAGIEHEYRIAGETWEMHWFHLNAEAGWQCDADHPVLLGPVLPGLEAVMQGLIGEEHSSQKNTGEVRREYCKLALLLIERLLVRTSAAAPTSRDGRLAQLWQEVAGNPQHPWTVEELASHLHVSAAHLHRITQQKYDCTPMQRVTAQRMEVARMLLRHTDYPLAMIADRTGYQSPFAFSKAFKRAAGLSPRAYRLQKQRATQQGQ